MGRLVLRSFLVMALLFGLVFAVGIAVLYHYHFPWPFAFAFAVVIVALQYGLSPYLIDWIYRINWHYPADISPEFAGFLTDLCKERNIPVPRFGIIEDSNPNAFTYGHVPGDARLVVTRGLQQMLTEEEFQAVVAHEVGHIRHCDFIVMTFAALAPLLLYILYTWTRGRRDNVAWVGFAAYLAYIVSQYIVLFLSRVREYFADEHAAQSVTDANLISSALIKIAYGLAKVPQADPKDKKATKSADLRTGTTVGALGICNFASAQALAISATNGAGEFSQETMLRAMQWDLWNPWAVLYELQSTHPLVARRVMAASRIARAKGQQPAFPLQMPSVNLWPAFWQDLLMTMLPWLGAVVGIGIGMLSIASGFAHVDSFSAPWWVLQYGWVLHYALLPAGIGWLVRLAFSYRSDFRPSEVVQLVSELEVSRIRCIPTELTGTIIGRGAPGLFWSKDLVLQDESGFITLIYRQPLGILETLFGVFRANKLVGKQCTVRGWYRRGPVPYLEIQQVEFADGLQLQVQNPSRIRVRTYYRAFLWTCAAICTAIGALLLMVPMP